MRATTASWAVLGWAIAVVLLPAVALARPVDADPVPRGDSYEVQVVNHTGRGVIVTVNYDYACEDGSRGSFSGSAYAPASGAQAFIAPWGCAPRREGDGRNRVTYIYVRNYDWRLAPNEMQFDIDQAEQKAQHEREARLREQAERQRLQEQQETDRKHRATCRVDEQGHFEVAKIAYGQVDRRCYEWFPGLKTAADNFRAEERRQQLEAQRRLETATRNYQVDAQHRQIAAMGARLDAAHREADAQEERRLKAEAAAREASARAEQDRAAQVVRDDAERAVRYQGDPCGAVADMRQRPPQTAAYPANATPQVRSSIDGYNARLADQWKLAIETQSSVCKTASAKKAESPALTPASIAPAVQQRSAAEARARADLARANEDGRETVRAQNAKTRDLADENAALRELLK